MNRDDVSGANAGCSHRPPCPGCPRFGESGLAPEVLQRLEQLALRTDAALHDVVEGGALGHRHRARLMVRGRARSPKIGIFQAGSHRIVDTPRCAVHHPRINEAAAALKTAIRETGSEPYADRPHRGQVRALQVVIERGTQSAQVTVVTRDESAAEAGPLLDKVLAIIVVRGAGPR